MSWNYRVLRHVRESGTEIFTIHESYYPDEYPDLFETASKTPHSVSADPVEIHAISRGKLVTLLNQVFTAFDFPTLEAARFNIYARYEREKTKRKANDLVGQLQQYKAEAKQWRREYLRLNSLLSSQKKRRTAKPELSGSVLEEEPV